MRGYDPFGASELRTRDSDRAMNLSQNPIQALCHVGIGEAQFEESVLLDRRAAFQIHLLLRGMMFAIQFDREPCIEAAKIGDEAGKWNLPTKFQARKAAIA